MPQKLGPVGRVSSSDVSDVLDQLKVKGVIRGLHPTDPDSSVLGPAFPVSVRLRIGTKKSLREGLLTAVKHAAPGSVLVISSESSSYSTWGGMMSKIARKSGLAGAVVYGSVRDTNEIREIHFPVFSKVTSPIGGYGRLEVSSIGRAVKCGNIAVRPGDIIVADNDGVVTVPRNLLSQVETRALALAAREKILLHKLT